MELPLIINIIILVAVVGVFVMLLLLYLNSKNNNQQADIKESFIDIERRLTDIINQRISNVEGSFHQGSKSMIEKFTKDTVELKDYILNLKKDVEKIHSFQDIFKVPKLRGQWGEAHLEYILRQHYPEEAYEIQYAFSSGEKVDAVLKLPNNRVLPIDSKFPIENFLRMQEAKSQEEKDAYRKKFIDDVQKEIEDIANKYIKPQEGTTDFAIMYLPAESLYYELLHHAGQFDILQKAWNKKVIITSPNTFYLTLRVLENWINQEKVSRQTMMIIKKLGAIQKDTEKLKEDFRKLGVHIKNAQSAYDSADKRLELWEGKVGSVLELGESSKELEGESKEEE